MSQLEGSLALGRAPASHGSPGGARARSAAAGLLIVLCLAAIAALPQREARFESPGSEGTAPGPQALSNSLGPPPANLAADTSAIALPAETTQPALPAAAERRAADAYARLPLAFVPNAGQTDERVRYYAQGAGYGLYFTDHKAVLALEKGERGHALELRFLGANPNAEPVARDRATGRVNYLTGSEHQTDLPTYGRVVYRDLWPGIDMTFLGEGGKLRYEFRLRPGAQASDIRLAYAGAEDVSLARGGALRINTPLGALRDAPPKSFQRINGRRVPVESRYALADDSYGFSVGRHDRGRPLVIDPSLAYSTYLGGGGFDYGDAVAVDSAGAAYVVGWTRSTEFPTTAGAFDTSATGGVEAADAFVTKLNPSGSGLSYSTFLGGSGFDGVFGIAVDPTGAAYVAGGTGSRDLPTTAGAVDTSFNGVNDVFVAKLNPAGSGLDYSTFLGGSGFEEGHGVAVDSAGAAYVAGSTASTNFPTTAGAVDTSFNGGFEDAFVTKLNPAGSALSYSAFLGGSAFESGQGVAVDSAGAAYVVGGTRSTDFPTTAGAFDTSANDADAFVTKLNPAGSGRSYSTLLGGSSSEIGFGVAVDPAGAAYVTGGTGSTDFPTTAGAFDTSANGDLNNAGDAFVTRLNPAGSGLSYSTFLGGSSSDIGRGIAVDSAGAAYVTGDTPSEDFPTTAGAFDTSFNGGSDDDPNDAFVTRLNPAGSGLSYSTFLGGSFPDTGREVAVDAAGAVYVIGRTSSTDFPTTAGAFDTSANPGDANAFVTKVALGPAFPAASCGQTIATNTTLQADLNCTGDGLIIGSDGITLNLGHHTITGDGDPGDVGVSNEAGHDDVTVRKGAIENFGAGVSVEGARRNLISRIRTLGGGYGIAVDDSRRTLLERNRAIGNDLNGFKLDGGRATLTENVASDNGDAGLLLTGAGVELRRNEASANAGDGVVLSVGSGGQLFRNRATDNTGSGIVCAEGCRLRGNQALRNGGDGIFASGTVGLGGNRAIHNGGDGILLVDCSFFEQTGNVAHENGQDGMHLLRCAGRNQANPSRIDAEAARNGRIGIFLEDSRFIALFGITPGNLDGIHLASSRGNRISGFSTGNDDDGIELSPGITDSNNNTIQHLEASGNGGDGIAISNSTRNHVRYNRATHNTGTGIALYASSRTYVGAGNVASDNDGNGIRIIGGRGGRNRVTENRAARNDGFGILLEDTMENNVWENRASGNVTGIVLGSGADVNLVETNTAVTNAIAGIELSDANENRVRRGNVASENGVNGIAVLGSSSGNSLLGNDADGNGLDGIFVDLATVGTLILHARARENSDDGIDVESADATVTENRANRNADLGIEAVPGVTDGGGNAASGNGNAAQCANVACSP